MNILELIATPAATAALTAAIVALVRKDVPKLDGWYVLVASFALAEVLSVAYMLLTAPATWYLGLVNGLVAFVAASGGTSWAQQNLTARKD